MSSCLMVLDSTIKCTRKFNRCPNPPGFGHPIPLLHHGLYTVDFQLKDSSIAFNPNDPTAYLYQAAPYTHKEPVPGWFAFGDATKRISIPGHQKSIEKYF